MSDRRGRVRTRATRRSHRTPLRGTASRDTPPPHPQRDDSRRHTIRSARNLTIMSHRGWVGRVAANKQLSAGIAIAVVIALGGIVAVAAGAGDDNKKKDNGALDVNAGKNNGLPSPGATGTESTTTVAGQQPAT